MNEQDVQRIVLERGQQELPPLPSNNSSFWKDGQVISQEVQPFKECDHYFIDKPDAVECKICHLGLPGLKAQDGKLLRPRR
jgi:hypothetical protein